jgi:tripartite-type tricarboxylate transporter receptor subunit TctC
MTMDKHLQRRQFLLTSTAAGLALAHPLGHAQGLPENARIFAGFAPGGTVDVTGRRVADKLRDVLAKSVVVENRTGAGGQIALSALKIAPADGLTLLVTPMSMLGIYPHTYKKLPYDPVADFQPVSQAVRFDFGFAVGPMVPASVKTLADFVGWCKANPKDANFGSPAAGSVPHFVAELFGRAAGVDLKHVPYRGTQPAIADLMGGQVASVSGPVGEFLQHLPTGKVRLLATSGAARSKFAPGVATYAEQGFKDIVFDEWFGFYMPAKVPADALNRAVTAIRNALGSPEVVEALALMGLEARPSSPTELAALLKNDSERWAPLIKTIGFTADS